MKTILLLNALVLFYAQPLWAGSLSMTTYYPAPQGIFDRFTLSPQTLPASCTIGTIMVDSTSNNLQYCHSINGNGVWGPVSNVWTESGDNVYPASTVPMSSQIILYSNGYGDVCNPAPVCQRCVPPKNGACTDVMPPDWCYCENAGDAYDTIFMGIGTSTPSFKLTLDNDGGILAMGMHGAGTSFNWNNMEVARVDTNPPIFHWYPRKSTLQIGAFTASGNFYDDSNIDDYSVAFGGISLLAPSGLHGRANLGTTQGGMNTLVGDYAVITGGTANTTSNDYTTVTGGQNVASGQYSTISGVGSFVNANYSTIAGGTTNNAFGLASTVGGGISNSVTSYGNYATISGGNSNSVSNWTDPVSPANTSDYSVIGGGLTNHGGMGDLSTIGGGQENTSVGPYQYIGGGYRNNSTLIVTSPVGSHAVIGGGRTNKAGGNFSVVTGGLSNYASGTNSTILGGSTNNASGNYSLVAGGYKNIISGINSVVAAGMDNNVLSADYSFAAGRNMYLTSAAGRAFVWGYKDSSAVIVSASNAFIIAPGTSSGVPWNPYFSIGDRNPGGVFTIKSDGSKDYLAVTSATSVVPTGNIFIVKANGYSGYVGIGNSNPQYPLQIGNIAGPQGILTIGGVWTVPSSRKYKMNIQPLDTRQAIETVMNLDPVTYNYKIDKTEHHVGFIAEDVPDLVAEEGRKSLEPMNVSAVLTAVLKDQKKTIQVQNEILNNLETELQSLKAGLHKN